MKVLEHVIRTEGPCSGKSACELRGQACADKGVSGCGGHNGDVGGWACGGCCVDPAGDSGGGRPGHSSAAGENRQRGRWHNAVMGNGWAGVEGVRWHLVTELRQRTPGS